MKTNEVRSFAAFAPALEVRSEDGKPTTITGYAAVFNEVTEIYEYGNESWREVIAPGAFARAIRENQDVACVIEHDWKDVVARRSGGTLTLEEDMKGLRVTIRPANTRRSHDLIEDIRAGNIKGMSFRFSINGIGGEETKTYAEGDKRVTLRTLKDVDISDVSFVVFPAYEGTSVELRTKPPEWKVQEPEAPKPDLLSLRVRATLACLD